jgi:succinyl-diaminopimelate desuccinylase
MFKEGISTSEVVDLSEKLIKIPSSKENHSAIEEIISSVRGELPGFKSQEFERNKVPSVLFFNSGEKPEKFRVLLHGHLDVVQANESQFQPIQKDGFLYGRGASDMKAGAAALICVFRSLAKNLPYPIGLSLTTDEEVGGFDGAGYQASEGVSSDFVISAESTNIKIAHGHKGVIIVEFEAITSGGHTSTDGNDKNAMQKIVNVVYKISQEYPEPSKDWKTTASVTKVDTSNLAHNKVPGDAKAEINFRWIPDNKPEEILENLRKIDPSVIVTTSAFGLAHETPVTQKDIRLLSKIIMNTTGKRARYQKLAGSSDVRHWTEKGAAGIDFGPVGTGFHSDNEYLEIESLGIYTEILSRFLKSIK